MTVDTPIFIQQTFPWSQRSHSVSVNLFLVCVYSHSNTLVSACCQHKSKPILRYHTTVWKCLKLYIFPRKQSCCGLHWLRRRHIQYKQWQSQKYPTAYSRLQNMDPFKKVLPFFFYSNYKVSRPTFFSTRQYSQWRFWPIFTSGATLGPAVLLEGKIKMTQK